MWHVYFLFTPISLTNTLFRFLLYLNVFNNQIPTLFWNISELIENRLSAIEELLVKPEVLTGLHSTLSRFCDIDQLLSLCAVVPKQVSWVSIFDINKGWFPICFLFIDFGPQCRSTSSIKLFFFNLAVLLRCWDVMS